MTLTQNQTANPDHGDAHEGNSRQINRPDSQIRMDKTYASGIELHKDTLVGQFSIIFPQTLIDEVGKDYFREVIKPVLDEPQQYQGGPQTKFHWDNPTKQWNLRFSFIKRDDAGNEIKKPNGKNEHIGYFEQANIIAQRVAEEIDNRLAEKLGIDKSAKLAF